ncbi:MAG: Integrase catalytic region, partial [Bacteroidetes bacterium]|nr:Integrase catalytic region [Bacteroidota bacterium]
MDGIRIIDNSSNQVFLSYSWIIENSDIPEKTVRFWSTRDVGVRFTEGNRAYIDYDTIPEQSRKKLPSKEGIISIYKEETNAFADNCQTYNCFAVLDTAYHVEFVKYRQIYIDLGFSGEKVTEYARKHAVWTRIVQLHDEHHKLRYIYDAYSMVLPGGYVYGRMNVNINKCKTSGVTSLLVKDARSNDNAKKYDARYEAFVVRFMSSGKAYERTIIHDALIEECERLGWEKPSYSWVKYCVARNMNHAKRGRYGEMEYFSKEESYAGIIKALYTHDQWQIDGWTLPFYMEGMTKLTLFAVMDASSGYIIGYDIAPTENTETILRGLERAVKVAKCLPYEIVSDNHSFNKTKEAEYLKINTDKLGMTWTVTSNPRHKGIIERRLGVLGRKFMKRYPGYIGEGIKTKNPDGRTSLEELTKYQRS